MTVDDAFHGITTLVTTSSPYGQAQASGFYYQKLAPGDPTKGPQWRAVEKTWLVTNRHVALPRVKEREIVPDTLAFNLRRIDGGTLRWEPVVLAKEEFLSRARFHRNREVDVCVIEVLDLLVEKVKDQRAQYQAWSAVHQGQLPGSNNITVEVADEAVVIGYPRGFYDQAHLFPIVKSGIIASRWGAPFQGKPCFLIDAKLFPGSSGSIVVSKPQQIAIVDGQLVYAKEKQFAFLGIFSGEPYRQEEPLDFDDVTVIRKSGFNVGIVWYGHLVDELIGEGVAYEGALG